MPNFVIKSKFKMVVTKFVIIDILFENTHTYLVEGVFFSAVFELTEVGCIGDRKLRKGGICT